MISGISSSSSNSQILSRPVQEQASTNDKRPPQSQMHGGGTDPSMMRAQGSINAAVMGQGGSGGPGAAGGGGGPGGPGGSGGGPGGAGGPGQAEDSEAYLVDLLSDDGDEDDATTTASSTQTGTTVEPTLEDLLALLAAG